MSWRLIKAVLILPGNVLGAIPAVILWASIGTRWEGSVAPATDLQLWPGLAAGAIGLVFMIWTMRLFAATGSGTPAPWDPIQQLVVAGPYRHVRNPMITGVILFLICEALVSRSWGIAAWATVFFAANYYYLPRHEEPALERRYGEPYREYKRNVPRWIPRLIPWAGGDRK